MQELNEEYAQRVEDIKAAVQDSEALATYLESEESDDYSALKDGYEPHLADLYEQVATENPLQLEALERVLVDPALEGLFMPRVLGYATLRPRLNARGQYVRPQEHLREVLLAIGESNAFDELQKRIGQGITTSFALSTPVWATKLINEIKNKRVRNFFENHRDDTIRIAEQRLEQHKRYGRQFAKDNYATGTFPTDEESLTQRTPDLENFLLYRVTHGLDNASLQGPVAALLADDALLGLPDYERLVVLIALFIEVADEQEGSVEGRLRTLRERDPAGFATRFFRQLRDLYHDGRATVGEDVDLRMASRVGDTPDDALVKYYTLVTQLHETGIDDLAMQDAIRVYVSERDGLSDELEGLRQAVLHYFRARISNLDVETYADFFEVSKLFQVYIDIFGSESFKQELRTRSLAFVKACIRRYTDKRGRDYQDIKKFVTTTFHDLGFMSEKEIANLFKTKRKKKVAEA